MRLIKHVAAAASIVLVAAGVLAAPAGAVSAPLSIDVASMYAGGRPCATAAPLPTLSGVGSILQAASAGGSATAASFDFSFQLWPVASPSTITAIDVTRFSPVIAATANVPYSALVSGSAYSWRVQVSDGTATSPWSPTCSFRYDVTSPSAPTVTSNYPEGIILGPLGESARFTFSGGADPGVAGFLYAWGDTLPLPACDYSGPLGQLICPDFLAQPDVAKASSPGGSATVSLTPPDAGPQRLSVASIDVAGNLSDRVQYQIFVPISSPTITVVGQHAICGNTATVKFSPHAGISGVTSYSYSLNPADPATTVRAGHDGTATVRIPATGRVLHVTSTSRNGFVSSSGLEFLDLDPQPSVQANLYLDDGQPAGGVGVPDTFTFSPPFDNTPISGFTYQFGHSKAHTVTKDPTTGDASITWAPERSGTQTLTVRSNDADASAGSSCALAYTFTVAGSPHK